MSRHCPAKQSGDQRLLTSQFRHPASIVQPDETLQVLGSTDTKLIGSFMGHLVHLRRHASLHRNGHLRPPPSTTLNCSHAGQRIFVPLQLGASISLGVSRKVPHILIPRPGNASRRAHLWLYAALCGTLAEWTLWVIGSPRFGVDVACPRWSLLA